MQYCTKCGHPVAGGARFCNHCGTPLIPEKPENICTNCGNKLKPDEKFCPVCGTPAGKMQSKKPQAPQSPRPSSRPPEEKKPRYTKEGRKIIDSGPRPASGSKLQKKRPATRPATGKNSRPPAGKKKGGFFHSPGKIVTGLLIVLITGIFIIYLLPDDPDSDQMSGDAGRIEQDLLKDITDQKPGKAGTAEVSKSNPTASISDVKIDFGPFNLTEAKNLTVSKYPEKIIKNECLVTAYEISLEGKTRFDDYFTISLPYDVSFIKKGDAYSCVVPQYFNEKSHEWEPVLYDIDTKNKVVIIQTDHLSKYGVFTVKNEGKRRAYVSGFYIPDSYFTEDARDMHLAVIEEYYSPRRSIGEKALSAGLSFWGSFSGPSGAAVNTLTLGGMYSTKFINRLNDGFKNMGYITSAIQLGYDLYRGDQKSAAVNLTKNLMNQMIAEINSVSLNLASVGIFVIDYTLTQYGNAAMAERYKNLFTVYDYYNKHYNPHKKTLAEWRRFFIETEKKYPENPEKVSDIIMREIDAYVESFITKMNLGTGHENTMEINAMAGEAGLKRVSWPNSDDILQLKGEAKQRLIDWLYPVFTSLNHYRLQKMKEELIKQCEAEQKIMNTVVPVTIMEDLDDDEEPDYANYIVCFRPLDKDADKKNWTGRLNDRGSVKTSFTIVGFVLAGEPNRVEIYDPEDDPDEDDPVFSKKFIVDPDGVTIYLESTELTDGPWEVLYLEGKPIYNTFSSEAFKHSLQTAAVKALVKSGVSEWNEGASEELANEQEKTDRKDDIERSKAVDQLKKEYNNTLNAGIVNIPEGSFEKLDDPLFLLQYKPVKKGNLYTFKMPVEDGEKGDETLVILNLKSDEYFEAKVFNKTKANISVDYIKGKLKK